MWLSDESSESESEQDSDEDKEEGWIDTLVETIIEPKDYRNREERIINFLRECLFARIYNVETSFEKRKVRKNEKKKYERLKKAFEILDDYDETMKYIVSKGTEYEEMEMEITNVGDGEYEEDNDEDEDDDDMEDNFRTIGEIRKSGGGKA
jgi:RNA processing factor Prp31